MHVDYFFATQGLKLPAHVVEVAQFFGPLGIKFSLELKCSSLNEDKVPIGDALRRNFLGLFVIQLESNF